MNILENIIPITIFLLLLIGWKKRNLRKKILFTTISLFILWGSFTYLGFFLPTLKYEQLIMYGFDLNKKDLNLPIKLIYKTKGIFSVENPIEVSAEIIDINKDKAKERFSARNINLGLTWNDCQNIPPIKGAKHGLNEGNGCVVLSPQKCKNKTIIKFTNSGKAKLNYIVTNMQENPVAANTLDENSMYASSLIISPVEAFISMKANLISNTIAIILLLIAVFEILRTYWKDELK